MKIIDNSLFFQTGAVQNYPPFMMPFSPEVMFSKPKAALYIHFPFCKNICSFCKYNRKNLYSSAAEKEYISALLKHIQMFSSYSEHDYDIRSIYFGGGTPSLITDNNLTAIFETLDLHFDLSNVEQISIEATTVSINEEQVKRLQKFGINRISMGLQSTDDTYLKMLHTQGRYRDFLNAYSCCVNNGITNVNVDMMYRLPGQDTDHWRNTLEAVIGLGVPHISVYCLALLKGTKLYEQVYGNEFPIPLHDKYEIEFKKITREILNSNDYISNTLDEYSRPGHENLYNKYTLSGATIGIGAGVSCNSHGYAYDTVADVDQYIHIINSGKLPIKYGLKLTPLRLMSRYMTLFPYYKVADRVFFKNAFGYEIETVFGEIIDHLLEENYIVITPSGYALTIKGEAYAPYVSRCFWDAEQKTMAENLSLFGE